MLRQQKAQSSVEYLGTYTWAFMGLLVTLGALSYFGVFNPSSYTPDGCNTGIQIVCEDFYLGQNTAGQTHLLLQVKNNYARSIVIENVEVRDHSFSTIEYPIVVPSGTLATMSIVEDDNTWSVGDKEEVVFNITYRREEGSEDYEVIGTAIAEVQESSFTFFPPGYMTGNEPFCGDKNINVLGEECDAPNDVPESNVDRPNSGCDTIASKYYTCLSDCTCDGYCGDGIVQKGVEVCEDDYYCEKTYGEDFYCNNCRCIDVYLPPGP